MTALASKTRSWRDVLPVHPAADLFPKMSRDELLALGKDIKKNGLKSPIVLWAAGDNENPGEYQLLDGRSRLDAMELVGLETFREHKLEDFRLGGSSHVARAGGASSVVIYLHQFVKSYCLGGSLKKARREPATNPYAYVISLNIHRRHLSAKDKRRLIGELLDADASKSNRAIAEMVKSNHHTVGAVRAEKESTGTISQLTKTTGKDGKARKQPVKRVARKLPEAEITGDDETYVGRDPEWDATCDALAEQAEVPEVPTTSPKRTSALPNGSPAPEKPPVQVAVAESDTQPTNPIYAAWIAATPDQRKRFAHDHGDDVVCEIKHRFDVWLTCNYIDSCIDDASDELQDRYEELRLGLDKLWEALDDEADETDEADEAAA